MKIILSLKIKESLFLFHELFRKAEISTKVKKKKKRARMRTEMSKLTFFLYVSINEVYCL